MIARFNITGTSVQGVQLRESIAKVAENRGLNGQVRNLLDGSVEILIIYKDNYSEIKQCITEAVEIIRKRGLIDDLDIQSIEINGRNFDAFREDTFEPDDKYEDKKTEKMIKSERNNFTIIRDHELKESVWALQGAGKIFLSTSKKVEEMLGYKEKEVIGRLESVKKELLYMQSNIQNVDDPVCLKQFISDPLVDFGAGKKEEEDLIRNLIEFYYHFLYYKKETPNLKETEKECREAELVKHINSLKKGIEKEIEKLNNVKS